MKHHHCLAEHLATWSKPRPMSSSWDLPVDSYQAPFVGYHVSDLGLSEHKVGYSAEWGYGMSLQQVVGSIVDSATRRRIRNRGQDLV